MRSGRHVFREFCENCEDETQLVMRSPELQDNAKLPSFFEHRLGDKIYRDLLDGFQGTKFNVPLPVSPDSSFEEVTNGVDQVLQVFVESGYALRASIADANSDDSTFSVLLEGPATVWGMQAVASWGSSVYPAYDVLAVAAYLRASGWEARCGLSWSTYNLRETWKIQRSGFPAV